MRLGTAGMKSAGRPRIQTPQAGQVVLSLAGRDAGRLMVVLERSVEEGFVLTADGRMALVGVTEHDSSGEEYFIRKDTFGGYKSYTVEEFPAV